MTTTTLRNNRGSVLMQVLAATAVMSISFYFLTSYVIGQKQQISKTSNVVNLRFALNSTMDYVLFGIRQKYCFIDQTLLPADSTSCDLTNPYSVERLIMSTDSENFIRQMVAQGTSVGNVDVNHIGLSSFTVTLNPTAITATHPLYSVVTQLRTVKDQTTNSVIPVSTISVTLTKDASGYLPRAGREVYLSAKVSLLNSLGSVIKLSNRELSLSSSIVIYPREIGSFALLVPEDLRMDVPYNTTMNNGDIAMHQFNNRKELGTSTGLVFLSPVFVNRDIYLPKVGDTGATADTSPYSAVTFADRVYIGNGWVRTAGGSQLYAPRTTGGMSDRYWTDATNFGGFLKGIEIDGGVDKGLQVFAGITPATTPDLSLMQKCAALSTSMGTISSLSKVNIQSYISSSSSSSTTYKVYFDRSDQFNPQSVSMTPSSKVNWGNGKINYDGSSTDAVIRVTFGLGTRSFSIPMALNSDLTVTPEVGSATQLAALQTDVATKTSTLASDQAALDQANSNLAAAKNSLSDANATLLAEQSKPKYRGTADTTSTSTSTSTSTDVSTTTSTSTDTTASNTTTTSTSTSTSTSSDYYSQSAVDAAQAAVDSWIATVKSLTTAVTTAQNAVAADTTALSSSQNTLSSYSSIYNNPPVITISVDGIKTSKRWGTYSSSTLSLTVSATNVGNMRDENMTPTAPSIGVLAYDPTYSNGASIKDGSGNSTSSSGLQGYLNFTNSGSVLNPPINFSSTSTSSAVAGASDPDTDDLEAQCEAAKNAASSQSFGGAAWAVDFSPSTRVSWNFAGSDDAVAGDDPAYKKDLVFSGSASSFDVHSIAGNCTIDATATFVTGFYTCDSLTISARSLPLRIIGTFIVGKLIIDPSAYKAGIRWSSIYYPQATQELRKYGILKSATGEDCNTVQKSPIWLPVPSIQEVQNVRLCNVISLRAKADPFQWTAVDPDCGIPPNSTSSTTSCKKRLIRFYVVEQSREGGV